MTQTLVATLPLPPGETYLLHAGRAVMEEQNAQRVARAKQREEVEQHSLPLSVVHDPRLQLGQSNH